MIDLEGMSEEEKRKRVKDLLKRRQKEADNHVIYAFEDIPEYKAVQVKQRIAKQLGMRNPYHQLTDGVSGSTIDVEGRTYVNFSSFNYLGIAAHPEVQKAAIDAINHFGTSSSASRLVAGNKVIHRELEEELADFLGVDDAMIFSAGYLTNAATIGWLIGKDDLVISDLASHNSTVTGTLLAQGQRLTFPHNNIEALGRLLSSERAKYKKALVCVEGVYSMDGDLAKLKELVELAKHHKAWLMIDEAHSIGTLGKTGRGITEHFGIDTKDVDILMGTLSKSLASCGGYIAGSHAFIDFARNDLPAHIYSTGIAPSVAAAALEALRVLRREPNRVSELIEISDYFRQKASELGLDTGPSHDSPVVPVIQGNSAHSVLLSEALYKSGVFVQPIIYPVVEEGSSRLRFFLSKDHTKKQIDESLEALRAEYDKILQDPKLKRMTLPISALGRWEDN